MQFNCIYIDDQITIQKTRRSAIESSSKLFTHNLYAINLHIVLLPNNKCILYKALLKDKHK